MSTSGERIMRLSTRCGFEIETAAGAGGKKAACSALNRKAGFKPSVSFQRHGKRVQNTDGNRAVYVKNMLRRQRNHCARIRTSDKTRLCRVPSLTKKCFTKKVRTVNGPSDFKETLRVYPANCREKTHRHGGFVHVFIITLQHHFVKKKYAAQ